MDFKEFPKMPRLSREIIVTEKIDGTNAQVAVVELDGYSAPGAVWEGDGLAIYAGSRTRWITPEADNFGFAAWVRDNAEELATLGPGNHFGEWWGEGTVWACDNDCFNGLDASAYLRMLAKVAGYRTRPAWVACACRGTAPARLGCLADLTLSAGAT